MAGEMKSRGSKESEPEPKHIIIFTFAFYKEDHEEDHETAETGVEGSDP